MSGQKCGKLCKAGNCVRCDAIRKWAAEDRPPKTLGEIDYENNEARRRFSPAAAHSSLRDYALQRAMGKNSKAEVR